MGLKMTLIFSEAAVPAEAYENWAGKIYKTKPLIYPGYDFFHFLSPYVPYSFLPLLIAVKACLKF